jgi:hypothetical protein
MTRLLARLLVELHVWWRAFAIAAVALRETLSGKKIDPNAVTGAIMGHRRVCYYQLPPGHSPSTAWRWLAGIECKCGRVFYRQRGWAPPDGPWEPMAGAGEGS